MTELKKFDRNGWLLVFIGQDFLEIECTKFHCVFVFRFHSYFVGAESPPPKKKLAALSETEIFVKIKLPKAPGGHSDKFGQGCSFQDIFGLPKKITGSKFQPPKK